MERSADGVGRPVVDSRAERPGNAIGPSTAVDGDERRSVALLLLLGGEILAFAALTASGNMPEIVSVLFRALLTL
jgi:hypothetical protein